MKKNVAILGANGQVGFELCNTLKDSYALNPMPVPSHVVDIRNSDQIKALFDEHYISYVVNAAAYTAVDGAETDSTNCFLINELGPYLLAKECSTRGIPLIHLSTDYIFGGNKDTPYKESDKAQPSGMYALSKFLGEEHVRREQPKHIILRTSWVYSSRRHNFVKTMLKLGQVRDTLDVVDDQMGCPTPASYLSDAIKMILLWAELNSDHFGVDKWGTYHYCGLESVSWYQFAEQIFRAANYDLISSETGRFIRLNRTSTKDFGALAPRPHNSVLDCTKIRKAFGVRQLSWEESLPDLVSSLMPNYV